MRAQPKLIKEVIKCLIEELNQKEGTKHNQILKVWNKAVGERAAEHTKLISLKKERLIVNVDSSSLLYHLALNKDKILEEIQRKTKGIKLRDILLRIGQI